MAFDPDFGSQLNIESIITAPLVAISKANVVMITGQTRALLENCFTRSSESGPHEPVMIQMTLSRARLDADAHGEQGGVNGRGAMRYDKLAFSVPLLCLVPINNLVVDKASVEFDMEVTSVTHRPADKGITGEAGKPVVQRRAVLNGRIASKAGDGPSDRRSSSTLKVNINAGPLPLPVGLLTVIDLYSKSVQPTLPSAAAGEAKR